MPSKDMTSSVNTFAEANFGATAHNQLRLTSYPKIVMAVADESLAYRDNGLTLALYILFWISAA
jgi:hypothetical protein